jgi:outer membrane protein OmpA-like peptidoglycan-associated protein
MHGEVSGRWTLSALAVVAALGTAGCAAKVNRDVYEAEIASIRSDIDGLDGRVTRNEGAIAGVQARLDTLARDLSALEEEFDAQVARLEYGVRFAAPVHFDFDRSDVRPSDVPLLQRFADVVGHQYEGAMITVEGFADPAGSQAYNQRLSERRAEAIVSWLTSSGGLDRGMLRTVGYGETRLVDPGAAGPGPDGLRNRRVAFVVEYAPSAARSTPVTDAGGQDSDGVVEGDAPVEG